jgi:branched-subunit amino acid transport protein
MIPDWKVWTVIAGLAVVTYLIRFSFIGLLAGRSLPAGLTRALGFVPVAVLPALIAPMVLNAGDAASGADPQRVIAAVAALAAGAVSRNVLAAIVAGMAAFVLLGAAGL